MSSPTLGDGPQDVARRRRSRAGGGGQLREDLLVAARAVVVRDGDAAVSVKAVADEAGVSPAALYLHFAGLEELRYEVAYTLFGEFMQEAHRSIRDLAPDERPERRGRTYLDFAFRYPGFYRLLFTRPDEEVPDRFEGLSDITQTNLGPMIAELRSSERAHPMSAEEAAVTACLLWMGVHGLASLATTLPGFPWPPRHVLVDRMMQLLSTLHRPT